MHLSRTMMASRVTPPAKEGAKVDGAEEAGGVATNGTYDGEVSKL